MNVEEKSMLRIIEQDERWLSDRLVDSVVPDADSIKMRVRIEIEERRIAPLFDDRTPEALVRVTRDRLRSIIAEQHGTGDVTVHWKGRGRVFLVASSLLSSAAAVALFVMAGGGSTASVDESSSVVLTAFEESDPTEEDFDRSLRALEEKIEALGTSFDRHAGTDSAGEGDDIWGWWESSEGDGEGADRPVGAGRQVRESGV